MLQNPVIIADDQTVGAGSDHTVGPDRTVTPNISRQNQSINNTPVMRNRTTPAYKTPQVFSTPAADSPLMHPPATQTTKSHPFTDVKYVKVSTVYV